MHGCSTVLAPCASIGPLHPSPKQRDFGYITDYQPPKVKHPGSIMSVSNTGGHGRGDQSGRIIGERAALHSILQLKTVNLP